MARIEFDRICKTWDDVVAVDELTLTIEDGEFVALLGPSGCGKSTTLLILAGIYAPTKGDLRFDGQVVNEVEARDRNVGIVFQSYALYPHMTVRQNILFPLRFKKVPETEARRRAEDAAKLVHISDLLDRRPSQLSGGQQQRVALARALVKEPQLLLLDEPLSNLDATLRMTMRSEIKSLQANLGVTTILVTHDQLEALTMSDIVAVMEEGRISQTAPPAEIYRRPGNRFVAGFIGQTNFLGGTVKAPPRGDTLGVVETAAGALACVLPEGVAVGQEVTLVVRPEDVHLAESAEGCDNLLEGEVEAVVYMGDALECQVALGGVRLRLRLHPSAAVERGQRIGLAIHGRDCRALAV